MNFVISWNPFCFSNSSIYPKQVMMLFSKGEEVAIAYIDGDLPFEEQQALLEGYGFRWRCTKWLKEGPPPNTRSLKSRLLRDEAMSLLIFTSWSTVEYCHLNFKSVDYISFGCWEWFSLMLMHKKKVHIHCIPIEQFTSTLSLLLRSAYYFFFSFFFAMGKLPKRYPTFTLFSNLDSSFNFTRLRVCIR